MAFINKYAAVVVVIFILLVAYFVFGRSKGDAKKKKKKKTKPTKSKTGRSKRSTSASKPKDDEDEDADEDEDCDDGDTDDKAIEEDAKELFNMVHEGLARGMQQDEFLEAAGDLADNFIYIELKQLYNECNDKKMDPMKGVTLKDYIRILKKESQV